MVHCGRKESSQIVFPNDDLDFEIWNSTLNARSGFINKASKSKEAVRSSPDSGQKVRLRGGKFPHSGYLEIFYSNQWGFVCDAGSWTMQEATMVCKQLGFSRHVAHV